MFDILSGPIQEPFEEENIRALPTLSPRRCKLLTQWPKVLYAPDSPEKDWRLILPFAATLENAFDTMTSILAHPHLSSGGRLVLFLKGAAEPEVREEAELWIATVGKYVAIQDCLALSFALDYEREDGAPDKDQTEIGALRSRAKPYGAVPTADTYWAADRLAEYCVGFLEEMSCYHSADGVVAMPPSSPDKPFDLPSYLAKKIGSAWGLENLSRYVRTDRSRGSLRNTAVDDKLTTIQGTIEVDADRVKSKVVLLVDDLYQSGISMNYCGMLLLRAGAKKVFGLACEKTCRNDDNISGGVCLER